LLGPSWASALLARRFAPSKIAPGDFVAASQLLDSSMQALFRRP